MINYEIIAGRQESLATLPHEIFGVSSVTDTDVGKQIAFTRNPVPGMCYVIKQDGQIYPKRDSGWKNFSPQDRFYLRYQGCGGWKIIPTDAGRCYFIDRTYCEGDEWHWIKDTNNIVCDDLNVSFTFPATNSEKIEHASGSITTNYDKNIVSISERNILSIDGDIEWTLSGNVKEVEGKRHVEAIKLVSGLIETKWVDYDMVVATPRQLMTCDNRLHLDGNRVLIAGCKIPDSVAVTLRRGDDKHTGDDFLLMNATGVLLKDGRCVEIYVVFDGLSSRGYGREDSQLLAGYWNDYVERYSTLYSSVEELLIDATNYCDCGLPIAKPEKDKRSYSAAAFLLIDRSSYRAYVANVGDCRVYQGETGNWTQITRDQTVLQDIADSEGITLSIFMKQYPNNRFKGVLSNHLGDPDRFTGIHVVTCDITNFAGHFMLSSDGTTPTLDQEEEADDDLTLQELVNRRADLAGDKGVKYPDGTTFLDDRVVIEVKGYRR